MYLSYETALKLKENGYPQIGMRGVFVGEIFPEDKLVYEPTLEELIEACGNDFGALDKDCGAEWTAFSRILAGVGMIERDGSTPSEAVAVLWLAVNG